MIYSIAVLERLNVKQMMENPSLCNPMVHSLIVVDYCALQERLEGEESPFWHNEKEILGLNWYGIPMKPPQCLLRILLATRKF